MVKSLKSAGSKAFSMFCDVFPTFKIGKTTYQKLHQPFSIPQQKHQDQASLTCVRCFLLDGFSAPQRRKACKERIAILSLFEVADFPKAPPQNRLPETDKYIV